MNERDDHAPPGPGGAPPDHPEELLAEYVDGVLDGADITQVEAHLASCHRCRQEVELAWRGRDALAGLSELPVPMGTTRAAVERARGSRRFARPVVRGTGAAAAAAIAAVSLWLGLRGGGPEQPRSAALGAAAASPTREISVPDVPYTASRVDYDEARIQALAGNLAAGIRGGRTDTAEASAFSPSAPVPAAVEAGNRAALERAYRCIVTGASVRKSAHAYEVIGARFKGDLAYIGAFTESPGAGQPEDRLLVYVVARSDCSLLSFAAQRL